MATPVSLKFAAHRLQRQKWKPEQIQAAMEEIFAILQVEDYSTEGEETHLSDGTHPSSSYRGYDFSDFPAISFQRLDRDTGQVLSELAITPDGITVTTHDPDTGETTVAGVGSGGGGFPGEVLSGGPGATYLVRITTSDDGDTEDVLATQLQIAATETIPTGTKCLVAQVGEDYFIQVPVWV